MDGDEADAAIDLILMARGAGRTVPMVPATKLAESEAECAWLRAQLALALDAGLVECESLRAQLRVVRTNYQEVLRSIPRD